MDITSLLDLMKYIAIGLGILGVIIIIIGLWKSQKELITRGTFLLIAVVFVAGCIYLISRVTEKRFSSGQFDSYYEAPYHDDSVY